MNQLELPKNFWSRVKSELKKSKSKCYTLCSRSETFSKAWNDDKLREQIKTIAQKFLTTKKADYTIGQVFLFLRKFEIQTSDAKAKQFRTDFVNWCVKNNH